MKDIALLNGDCLQLMKDIPDGSVDMILCDLPYGITSNKWDVVIDFDDLWSEYKRIIKDNGIIALTASQPFSSALLMSNKTMFRHEWIWIKNRGSNFANTVREPMKEHEHVLIFCKKRSGWTYNKQMQERTGGGLSRVKYEFNGIPDSTNYGKFSRENNNRGALRCPSSWQKFNTEVGLHPTQKPVALMEYLIKTYTNEGDTVMDNCMGSGSTGIACVNTGRNFIGIELDEGYFDVARKRIEDAAEAAENKIEMCLKVGRNDV